MKRHILPLIMALASAPAWADSTGEGFALMERGAQMILREFVQDMDPALRDALRQMGPQVMAILTQIDDFRHYQAPEILPNGDILIRRKPGAPVLNAPEEEIEL